MKSFDDEQISAAKRQQLWCEAAQNVTLLDNILVQDSSKSSCFTQCFGVDAKYAKHLSIFGGGPRLINLQVSCEELPYDLVSQAKTEELPDGCARDAWERLTSEYDLTEGEDKITLLSTFQQNQMEEFTTNITVWLTSLAIQINKFKKLNHGLDEEYQITHILANFTRRVQQCGGAN